MSVQSGSSLPAASSWASSAIPAWAFVGAILIVLAVGWYIRMNLT